MITTAGDISMGKMDFKLNVLAELLIDVMLIFEEFRNDVYHVCNVFVDFVMFCEVL